jgi:cob(I)alamin adenosyltransferase
MIIVYTGNGKGKTTAAIGQVIRFLGHSLKVCIIQLFKDKKFYGEQKILYKFKNVDFFHFAKTHPYFDKKITIDIVKKQCNFAMAKIKDIMINFKNKYDLIILDEFSIALRDKFIDESEFIFIIKQLSNKTNIIITGRSVCKKIIEIADIVTEMKEIKHSYNNHIKYKIGIEY